ncbi:MAG: hypothetical protein JXB48_17050 [Candidatus Latescibacteria bacterium]|nr:hypothetical protein [Candidatus Latescibacterota bacterium]
MIRRYFILSAIMAFFQSVFVYAELPSPAHVEDAMKRASEFFTSISTNGGYVGIYSPDLKTRYGEAAYEKATADQIWVQPPGTPSVGECYLWAYKLTGDPWYLHSARATALALAWGQREEGGWDHLVDVSHFDPVSATPVKKSGRCTLDDNISQGALTFLMRLDQVIDEQWLTDSVELGLKFMMEAQFDNGAWPQWYPLIGGYHDYYTFNDNTINDCMRVMLLAHELYGRENYLESVKRCGDFIIASQIAAPQYGWAQQYSHDMKPAWARAFEPVGVCSAVTSRNIRTLIDLYLKTGEEKYLAPIPKAIEWLEKSKIAENTWSRFYELETNTPIYGDRDNKVHYTLEEISEERRKGYSWQSSYGIPGAIKEYRSLMDMGADAYRAERGKSLTAEEKRDIASSMMPEVFDILVALDYKGRWIDSDSWMITCRTFVNNMNTLCRYQELSE